MAEKQGTFLSSLMPGPTDSEAIIRAHRDQVLAANSGDKWAGRNAISYQQGRQIGTLGAAVKGLFKKEEGQNWKQGMRASVQLDRDRQAAQIMGVSVDDLQRDRRIKHRISQLKVLDDGTPETRLNILDNVIQIYNDEGNVDAVQSLLKARLQAKGEIDAFEKEKAESYDAQVPDAWRADGTPVTGTFAKQDGRVGLITENGFEPFSADLLRIDPNKTKGNLQKMLREQITPSARTAIKQQIVANRATVRKSQRVIDTLFQLGDRANSIMSKSGDIISATDNLIRNVKGVVDSFTGGFSSFKDDARGAGNVNKGEHSEYWSGSDYWNNKAHDATDSIWSMFPESVREDSAAAQQHRAQILELAYMAARIAEPSNRGLSDNDIKYALQRIAGDTSNPQVMVRRFVEAIGDAMYEVDAMIDTYSVPGYTADEIAFGLGGQSYFDMKAERDAMFERYDIQINEVGRAVLGTQLDSDIGPQEPTIPEDDAAFLESIGIPQE